MPEHIDPKQLTRRPHQIDEHISTRLRALRISRGVSQEELGGKLGITFQQVQKYERGINRIAASRLYQVATILDCSIQYFFAGWEEDQPDSEMVPEAMHPNEIAELVLAFSKLSKAEHKGAVLNLIRLLAADNSSGIPEPTAPAGSS